MTAISFVFRWLVYFAGFSLVIFVGLQFIRPKLTHPPVVADFQAPPEVKQIFVTSCYDCHSNQTKLAWFDRIVPGYWLVVSDVRKGRAHLNFSDFGKSPPGEQIGALFESADQMEQGAMPPAKYTLLHPGAAVTPAQLAILKNYLKTFEADKVSTPAQTAAADSQYAQWAQGHAPPANPRPALNGFAFPTGYQDWKELSTTDRSDNHTMRVILGNDIAIQAVKDNRINPWPDGAMFAKIAWTDLVDEKGNIEPGTFKQVEFMKKDSQGHASTLGWEFGRWLGTDLRPYGKDSSFATSCVSCHTPMRENDFVFTMPLKTGP
jgi:mono/diheme cytochrome c family protein